MLTVGKSKAVVKDGHLFWEHTMLESYRLSAELSCKGFEVLFRFNKIIHSQLMSDVFHENRRGRGGIFA